MCLRHDTTDIYYAECEITWPSNHPQTVPNDSTVPYLTLEIIDDLDP
jgi:hypothetical protein